MMRFQTFMVCYISVIMIMSISFIILARIGMYQFFFCTLGVAFLLIIIFLVTEKLSERLSVKFAKAKPEELQREDDVLLQAVAFSQSVLFVLVNLTGGIDKLILSLLIVTFTVSFYVLRAWAKIKDSPKYRYYSMIVFAFLSGNTFASFILATCDYFFKISLPYHFLVVVISLSIGDVFLELARSLFKIRYGYDTQN